MAKLPHIKDSVLTANMDEPAFRALWELQLMPPAGVVVPDTISEQLIAISGLDTLNPAPGTVSQNYAMGQKRQFSALVTNNIHHLGLTLNLNLHGPDVNDPMILNCFDGWNALRVNPKTYAMGLKRNYVGQMVLTEFNQVGTVWRVVTYMYAFPENKCSGIDGADKNSDDIYSCSVTMTSELAIPVTVGEQILGD